MVIWLASGSPRRRELLTSAGFHLEIHPPDVDESRPEGLDPVAHARRLAQLKAATAPADQVAVAADTVVHVEDRVFEKPSSREEAAEHLRFLSGRWHEVTTGVCVRHGDHELPFTVTTPVRFRTLSEAEIQRYLATGEADDKAGGYGVQGLGAFLVAELKGSWTNVMGLPVEETLAALAELGVQA